MKLADGQSYQRVPDLNSKISSKPDSPGIRLEKLDTLEKNVKYKLLVRTHAPGVADGLAGYDFTVNFPPTGGRCDVNPSSGTALETQFHFLCSNWRDIDNDQPIRYQFSYESEKGLYTIVSYGKDAEAFTKLPVGDPKLSYKLKFVVAIMDSLSDSTTFSVPVTVSCLRFQGPFPT